MISNVTTGHCLSQRSDVEDADRLSGRHTTSNYA